jgi:hypothetical protein
MSRSGAANSPVRILVGWRTGITLEGGLFNRRSCQDLMTPVGLSGWQQQQEGG